MIDGFPRSANSFAAHSFIQAQNNPSLIVGHHTHSFAQILKATRLRKPVILLIRHPYAAVLSLKALALENNEGDLASIDRYPPHLDLEYYTQFYRKTFSVRDQLLLSPFEIVTSDYGIIIECCNLKFGTHFRTFDHNQETQRMIFDKGGYHLSPSPDREAYKRIVKDYLDSPRNKVLLDHAQELYLKWIDYHLRLYPEDQSIIKKIQ